MKDPLDQMSAPPKKSKTLEAITLTAPDGPTSRLLVGRAKNPEAPLIVVIPALGMEGGYYDRFAISLVRRGMNVAVMELRGNGTSSIRASRRVDFGYGTALQIDIPLALEAANALFPRSPLYFLGHSLGGQLATAYAGLHPDAGIRGLLLVASGTPYYKTWTFPEAQILWVIAHTFRWITSLVGYFPGKRIGFARRESRTVMRDWSRLVHEGKFRLTKWDGPDIEEAISRLQLPVLSITLEKDIFVPVHVAEHMLAKMPGAQVDRWHWNPEAGGEPPTHHVRWPRRGDPIADRISAWVLPEA